MRSTLFNKAGVRVAVATAAEEAVVAVAAGTVVVRGSAIKTAGAARFGAAVLAEETVTGDVLTLLR